MRGIASSLLLPLLPLDGAFFSFLRLLLLGPSFLPPFVPSVAAAAAAAAAATAAVVVKAVWCQPRLAFHDVGPAGKSFTSCLARRVPSSSTARPGTAGGRGAAAAVTTGEVAVALPAALAAPRDDDRKVVVAVNAEEDEDEEDEEEEEELAISGGGGGWIKASPRFSGFAANSASERLRGKPNAMWALTSFATSRKYVVLGPSCTSSANSSSRSKHA